MTSHRNFGLDLLRVIAILFVIIDHTVVVHIQGGLHVLCMCVVGCGTSLFFMISGALLLPVSGSGRDFLFKRFRRVLIPFAVWSIVYLLLEFFNEGWSFSKLWQEFYSLPVKPSFGAGWFVYVMLGLYLIAPVVSVWLRHTSRRLIEYYLLMWIMTTVLPYFFFFVKYPLEVSDTPIGTFAGYLGYMLLGYYLSHFPLSFESKKRRWITWMLIFVTAILLPLRLYFFTCKYGISGLLYDDQTINMVAVSIIFFVLLLSVKPKLEKIRQVIESVSKMSYGMYLCHVLIYQYVIPSSYVTGNGVENVAVTFMAVVILSYIFSLMMSKLPFGKYVV